MGGNDHIYSFWVQLSQTISRARIYFWLIDMISLTKEQSLIKGKDILACLLIPDLKPFCEFK